MRNFFNQALVHFIKQEAAKYAFHQPLYKTPTARRKCNAAKAAS